MALKFELLRPDDLVTLKIEARNLRLDTSDHKNPKLVVEQSSKTAYLIFTFPPQSILEKAYFEVAQNVAQEPPFNHPVPLPAPQPPALPNAPDSLDTAGSVPVRMAGPSQLVFRLPPSLKEIPYRIDALLDWSKLELMLSPAALAIPKPPPLLRPGPLQSFIEMPFRLMISPGGGVGWTHSRLPKTHSGLTELWHTRIAKIQKVQTKSGVQYKFVEASDKNPIPLRAIWSPDFTDHGVLPDFTDPNPFPAAMSRRDRAELVILTSGVTGYYVPNAAGGFTTWVPKPVQASRVFLSALGGWLSSRGSWPTVPGYTVNAVPQALELTEWVHLATEGRDHYVKVVYAGYLHPFGHRASLVKVTERKFVPPDGGNVTSTTAYLKQHLYVVVREREKTYPPISYQNDGREMPLYRRIRINTVVTPDIDPPSMLPGGSQPHISFWINVNNAGFPFHLTGEDLAGKTIDFVTPLIFMADSEPDPVDVGSQYAASGNLRLCSVKGQKMAYADPSAGDTTLKTLGLFFASQPLQISPPPYPEAPFLPTLDQASVTVPALEQLLGTSQPVTIELYKPYLTGNLDPHAGVYADIVSTPPPLQFSAEQAGGFATPNMTLKALSARKGLVAGQASDAAAGLINPSDFFDGFTAKLFGVIPLGNLIPTVSGKADAGKNAPEIRNQTLPNSKNPQTLVTKIHWSPQLQSYNLPPLTIQFNSGSELALNATIERSLKGGPPSSNISGKLSKFAVSLLGVIDLNISSIKFTSQNGQKTNVVATLPSKNPITFTGALAFVQTLAQVLPPGIFAGNGPSIDLEPTAVRVTYTLGLPPVSIGVFSLENISFMTGLDLPYVDGKPGFEFAFAKRSSPFLLTVELIGGGGFVHIVLDTSGVQMVEGALEFGGNFSLDLGVASGAVHIMAGIYFQLKTIQLSGGRTGNETTITGFVDIGGEVSVLGIISISIDLNLSLTYQTSNGKKMVEGRATLTVSVSVLFFSVSVQISVEKSYGSTSGDPRAGKVLSYPDWAEYAGAFAPAGA